MTWHMIDLLKRFQNVKSSGNGFTAQCPAHDDKQNSLSIAQQNGKWLIKCHAGCTTEHVLHAAGLTFKDLFTDEPSKERASTGERRSASEQPRNGATVGGLTLEQYAAAKQLPVPYLEKLGLSTVT